MQNTRILFIELSMDFEFNKIGTHFDFVLPKCKRMILER